MGQNCLFHRARLKQEVVIQIAFCRLTPDII